MPLLFDNAEARPILQTVGGGGQDSTRCMQTPHLETSDEASLAINSVQDRMFAPSVESVVNAWNTFGPIGAKSPLMSTVLRFRLYDQAVTRMAPTAYPGTGVSEGHIVTVFRSEMTFKKALRIHQLQIVDSTQGPSVPVCFVGGQNPGQSAPIVSEMAEMPPVGPGVEPFHLAIEPGGWFAAWSNESAQASIFFSRGGLPMDLQISRASPVTSTRPILMAAINSSTAAVAAGETWVYELAQLGTSLRTNVSSLADVTAIVEYLNAPTGLSIVRGTRRTGPSFAGLLEVLPDATDGVAEVAVGGHPDPAMLLPMRGCGLNRRWTVGLWQVSGFGGAGHYTAAGEGRYTELGVDELNCSHVPLYTGRAPRTHVVLGHPVVARGAGSEDIFVQVTRLRLINGSMTFSVAANNPTGR